jgi:hypothetical protein
MTFSRRDFLHSVAMSAAAMSPAALSPAASSTGPGLDAAQRSTARAPGAAPRRIVKPPRLRAGDVVGLVDPASVTWERST